ncbi:MAG TPA: molybdenum cofactor biosynthesis protein MoaE [Gammaproteobacteria bacterium]|nr:molybdenum cofactor biosynthesis protein MoaE [Gammaproteobacteria bacterium]
MPAILLDTVFNPWEEIQRYQDKHLQAGHYGATASFVGTMRDFNINENVSHMTLEHYPAMTQHYLDRLCADSIQRFELDDCLVIHRFGDIRPDEPIVLTVAWSPHRAQAFDACRHLMEELKSKAPFWKKEVTDKGERWVHNDA